MRRPVKPFVTEYRGAGRRQSAAGGQVPKADFSSLDQEPPSPEPRPAFRSVAEPSEDSYEAALRAADALFSAKSERPGAPAAVAAPEPDATSDAPEAHPAGGRILRVLDEPPDPEMLRLEAERAPKRRGRKPGSKNKPKPAAIESESSPASLAHALPAMEAEVAPPASALPARVLAMPARLPAVLSSAARPPAAGDKYAWVRTKLKPGQQWKRRLPKVAW